MDFILNGSAHGDVASRLMASNFDVNALRPYTAEDGRSYYTVNQGGNPTAQLLSLIHISEPTRRTERSRMPSSA